VRLFFSDVGLIPKEKGSSKFMIIPFFHVYGLFTTLSNIYYLRRIVFLKKFEENLFLRTIEKYRITILSLVPPIMVLLAKSPLVDKYDLSSVKHLICGAASLSRETEEILKRRLKVNSIRQGYGLTEVNLGLGIPLGVEKNGSVGKVVSYMSSKIRDHKTGKSLGPNQSGELCFKGATVMKGYYRDEEATRKAFTTDGWFLTGDLAYYDEEEFFFIVGRLKDLIKYKGFQVSPQELEAILLRNPKIKDVAVVGVPDEEAGELPLAFVVKNFDVNLTEDEVKHFLADKVSYHKRLRGGVRFVSEIPKSASGKILKRKLSELLNK
jgi:4-coumarate--CoA ligase